MNLRDKLNFCAKSESRQVMFDQAEARLLLAALELAERVWSNNEGEYTEVDHAEDARIIAAFRAAKEAYEQGAKG